MSNNTQIDDLVDIFNKMENASPELRVIFGFPATGDLLPTQEGVKRNKAIRDVRRAIREMHPDYDPMRYRR